MKTKPIKCWALRDEKGLLSKSDWWQTVSVWPSKAEAAHMADPGETPVRVYILTEQQYQELKDAQGPRPTPKTGAA